MNISTTLCKLERGAFRITGQRIDFQDNGWFDVVVSDDDAEVTASFPSSQVGGNKLRLSVQELGWAFRALLWMANDGDTHYRKQVLLLDIAGDDIPAVIDELTAKYDLSPEYMIGVDVGFGADHTVKAIREKGNLDLIYIDDMSLERHVDMTSLADIALWLQYLPKRRWILSGVKELDYMIDNGCRPSQFDLWSELHSNCERECIAGHDIDHVILDEAMDVTATPK